MVVPGNKGLPARGPKKSEPEAGRTTSPSSPRVRQATSGLPLGGGAEDAVGEAQGCSGALPTEGRVTRFLCAA